MSRLPTTVRPLRGAVAPLPSPSAGPSSHPVRRLLARSGAARGPAVALPDPESPLATVPAAADALCWERRVVEQSSERHFTITVPIEGVPPRPAGDRDASICSVDDLWVGFPAPDGMRISAATAMIGVEDGAPCLRLHFEVQGRFTEQRLSAGAMTSLLRQTLARVS